MGIIKSRDEKTKPKLLLVCRSSFGYMTDTYQWCKYLKKYYDITYICREDEFGREKIFHDGVRVMYSTWSDNKFIRHVKFLLLIVKENSLRYDICIVQYFPICFVIKLMKPSNEFILDIRTGAVFQSKIKRWFYDFIMKNEAILFSRKTIISEELSSKLNFGKSHIIPLGADVISKKNRTFDEIHMIYVGTLHNRNIEKTILGFCNFYREYENRVKISYTIIGNGPNNEEQCLNNYIIAEGLENSIRVEGYIKHDRLKKYFNRSNVGVSFVPITAYYNCQPPTKTYEYLLSGMPVIATATTENRNIINPINGVLIDDTSEAFYHGLVELYERRYEFDSRRIRSTVSEYTWENIVLNKLKPYLERFLDK